MRENVSSAIDIYNQISALAIEAGPRGISTKIIDSMRPFLMIFQYYLLHLYCFVLAVGTAICLAFGLHSRQSMSYYCCHRYCQIDSWPSHVFASASSYSSDYFRYSGCLTHLECLLDCCCYCNTKKKKKKFLIKNDKKIFIFSSQYLLTKF